MPIARRMKSAGKILLQVGLTTGLLFVLSGCGKSHYWGKSLFVWPEFFITAEEESDENFVKGTGDEYAPSLQTLAEDEIENDEIQTFEEISEAEESQMASKQFESLDSVRRVSAHESEMPQEMEEGSQVMSQNEAVSRMDSADSEEIVAKASEPTPKVETLAPSSNATARATRSAEMDQEDTLSNIYFRYKKSIFTREALDTLAGQLQYLKKNKDLQVEIRGHCDTKGSRAYNKALGQARANAVKSFLVNNGIESSRLKAVSYGKDVLVCDQGVESCQKQNRRVELVRVE